MSTDVFDRAARNLLDKAIEEYAQNHDKAVAKGLNPFEEALTEPKLLQCKLEGDEVKVQMPMESAMVRRFLRDSIGKAALCEGASSFLKRGLSDVFFLIWEGWTAPAHDITRKELEENWATHGRGDVHHLRGSKSSVMVTQYSRNGTRVYTQAMDGKTRYGAVSVMGHGLPLPDDKPDKKPGEVKFEGSMVMQPILDNDAPLGANTTKH